jgi:hypothetical protein
MRLLSMAALALPLLTLVSSRAVAQAPPPIGRWASAAGNVLVVNDNATCTYLTAQLRVQGNCSWRAGGPADGILIIDYVAAASALRQMDVSIHWLNYGHILVLGEPFQRG